LDVDCRLPTPFGTRTTFPFSFRFIFHTTTLPSFLCWTRVRLRTPFFLTPGLPDHHWTSPHRTLTLWTFLRCVYHLTCGRSHQVLPISPLFHASSPFYATPLCIPFTGLRSPLHFSPHVADIGSASPLRFLYRTHFLHVAATGSDLSPPRTLPFSSCDVSHRHAHTVCTTISVCGCYIACLFSGRGPFATFSSVALHLFPHHSCLRTTRFLLPARWNCTLCTTLLHARYTHHTPPRTTPCADATTLPLSGSSARHIPPHDFFPCQDRGTHRCDHASGRFAFCGFLFHQFTTPCMRTHGPLHRTFADTRTFTTTVASHSPVRWFHRGFTYCRAGCLWLLRAGRRFTFSGRLPSGSAFPTPARASFLRILFVATHVCSTPLFGPGKFLADMPAPLAFTHDFHTTSFSRFFVLTPFLHTLDLLRFTGSFSPRLPRVGPFFLGPSRAVLPSSLAHATVPRHLPWTPPHHLSHFGRLHLHVGFPLVSCTFWLSSWTGHTRHTFPLFILL